MQQPMQPLLQHLFQASSLEDVSRARLEAFVEEYPSFGIGHYLLSRKLRSEGSERFVMETQRTGLYFTNPFWLQWQLDHVDGGVRGATAARVWEPVAPMETAADWGEGASEGSAGADAGVGGSDEVVTAAAASDDMATAASAAVGSADAAYVAQDGAVEHLVAGETLAMAGEAVIEAEPEVHDVEPGREVGSAIAEQEAHSSITEQEAHSAVADSETHGGTAETAAAEIRQEPIRDEEAPFVLEETTDKPGVVDEAGVAATSAVAVAEESYQVATDEVPGAQAAATQGLSAADELLRSIAEARGLRESLHKINEETAPGEPPADHRPAEQPPAVEPVADARPAEQPPAVEPVTDAPVSHEMPIAAEQPIHDEETPFVLDEPEAGPQIVSEPGVASEVAAAQPEPQIPHVTEATHESQLEPQSEPQIPHVAAAAREAQAEANKPVAQPAGDLVFEPYHTIDYFASQGIKVSLDDNPTDKFGKQLKSFTDWLKGMRRLPQKDREVVPDRVAEQAIQNFAAHSIEGKDVLTETMADVLAKQGMRERARAVYEKLSLLNPDKRAYFAAKIEQLNTP
jgi:hypothetical protein